MVDGGYAAAYGVSQAPPSPPTEPPPPALNATDAKGLRWTWSTYPAATAQTLGGAAATASKREIPHFCLSRSMVVPLACTWQPLIPLGDDAVEVQGPGLECSVCGCFCSVHSVRDEGRSWVCFSCLHKYAAPNNVVLSQHPHFQSEVVECVLAPSPASPSAPAAGIPAAIMFVVDICVSTEELVAMKRHVQEVLEWLSPDTLIGCITFGSSCVVWELGGEVAALNRSYVIRGATAYSADVVRQSLQLRAEDSSLGRFLVPVSEGAAAFLSRLDYLRPDSRPVPQPLRAQRVTGTALQVAAVVIDCLAPPSAGSAKSAAAANSKGSNGEESVPLPSFESTAQRVPSRVLLFLGGPCTRGAGAVASLEKANLMRFHRDILEGELPLYEQAVGFYQRLANRLVSVNTSVDLFAQSYDQVGVLELQSCVNGTGGYMICGDAFDHENCAQSVRRYGLRTGLCTPEQHQEDGGAGEEDGGWAAANAGICGTSVELEVFTAGGDLQVEALLGPCVKAAPRQHAGGKPSTSWFVSRLQQEATMVVVFSSPSTEASKGKNTTQQQQQQQQQSSHRFVQFVVRYVTSTGERRMRITSTMLPIAPYNASPAYFAQGGTFDQMCAVTVLARLAVNAMDRHPAKWESIRQSLDDVLIRFVEHFATYNMGSPDTVRMDPSLSLFPIFIFHLRRSEYFMVLNISPDETTFKRHWLMREPVEQCVTMVQPALYSYDLENPVATAVSLDSESLRSDNIVLMDAYFNLHIMWGSAIYEWIKAGYHNQEEYSYFADLLAVAESDAQLLLSQRFPYPRFSRTDANGSEARHVKTRVNPTHTYSGAGEAGASALYPSSAAHTGGDVINTDEANIAKFMTSLKVAVTTGEAKERNVKDVLVESKQMVSSLLTSRE